VPAEPWWRRVLAWLSPPLDPDDDDLLPRPDPPVEDANVRLARASSALNAAQNEWAQAVAMLAARRLER
jgi:hypothetical protein